MSPTPEPSFVRVAAAIGDATRARMLASLLDGSLMTAGEIAKAADVTPQTASVHLARLEAAGLVAVRAQGRHRYFRLADGDVAHALEALAVVADRREDVAPHRRNWSRDAMRPLRHARSCYGHLAGELGVRLHDALIRNGAVVNAEGRYDLGPSGRDWLNSVGIDPSGIHAASRGVVYPCVDWSERRDHLAGPLAVALLDRCIDRHWLIRVADSRALLVNAAKRREFERLFAIDAGPAVTPCAGHH